jgi:hypothetical protein
MKSYRIRSTFGLPMVSAVIVGPRGAARVELVFDSGAATTQLHIGTLVGVGFSFTGRTPDAVVRGITGGPERGFAVSANRLHLLGKHYDQYKLFAFDLSTWAEEGIDGLLGWDLIQRLHFEVDGPHQSLIVF